MEDEVQGETELVMEMTVAEKEAEKQVELEGKIPAKFYIRKVDLEKPGHTDKQKHMEHAELASSRRWRTTIAL